MSDVPEMTALYQLQFEQEREQAKRRLAMTRAERDAASNASGNAQGAPESIQAILAPLLAIQAEIASRMASTVCEGNRDNVSSCHQYVERDCPQNKSNNCPKRVLEYEAHLEKLQRDRYGTIPPHLTGAGMYEAMGIPAGIAGLLANSTVEATPACKLADAWWHAKPRPRVLVLSGYSQIGKSVAAASLVARYSGRFIHLPTKFLNGIKNPAYLNDLLYPTLLVLDDLGSEGLDGWDNFKSKFGSLFCSRVDSGLWTIVTTNSAGTIRERYGDRVAERINKHGQVKNIAEVKP